MTLPEAAQFRTVSTWLGVQEWWMLHPHSGLLHGQAYRQHWGADRFTCAPWNQDDFSWTNYGMVQLYIVYSSLGKKTRFSFSHLHRFAPHWATVRAWVVSLVSSKQSAKLCLSQKRKGESPQLDQSPKRNTRRGCGWFSRCAHEPSSGVL